MHVNRTKIDQQPCIYKFIQWSNEQLKLVATERQRSPCFITQRVIFSPSKPESIAAPSAGDDKLSTVDRHQSYREGKL